jgi:lipopolysaccharide biosynthesis regulator YciM
LAAYFLKKLAENKDTVETAKICQYCGYATEKWARACPSCRNTFPI